MALPPSQRRDLLTFLGALMHRETGRHERSHAVRRCSERRRDRRARRGDRRGGGRDPARSCTGRSAGAPRR